jgi:hypothetical protein
MDGKLLKSSFQWFKYQVIWSSLQRVMLFRGRGQEGYYEKNGQSSQQNKALKEA